MIFFLSFASLLTLQLYSMMSRLPDRNPKFTVAETLSGRIVTVDSPSSEAAAIYKFENHLPYNTESELI